MSATSSPPLPSSADKVGESPAISSAEINASCCIPLVVLFACSSVWLIVSSTFALIASIKFHSPDFLADCAWLTYGRVHPAQLNALVYGFGAQAGLGVALWLLCHLGRTKLALPGVVTVAAILWNAGVKIGILGILSGDSTGFEWLEMPGYASPILFLAYVLIGIAGVLTFYNRRVRQLYVSQWFLLAALFWFPWIYSTANLLLVFAPVRGVAQAVIAWWYANNLTAIWFGFIGLAAIFYFIPKITGRPLHSRQLALFTFWTLAMFGSWAGIPSGTPLPAWMPALSAVGALLTLVPILAIAINLHQTIAGDYGKLGASPSLRFMGFGVGAYFVFGLAAAITSLSSAGEVTKLTWFTPALNQLGVYGFFVMTMFGAIYYIVPRLLQLEFPSAKLITLHFWFAALGILVFVLSLGIGGVVEGAKLNDAKVPFMEVVKATLPFLRISTVGDLLMLLGHLGLVANLAWLLGRCCCACCLPMFASAMKSETTGVAS